MPEKFKQYLHNTPHVYIGLIAIPLLPLVLAVMFLWVFGMLVKEFLEMLDA